MGRYEISYDNFQELIHSMLFFMPTSSQIEITKNVLFDLRLPRILAVILVGASLSISGTALQAMFLNPLVSPGILGILAGASFGAALGILLFDAWIIIQFFAFLFGFVAVFFALLVAKIYDKNANKTILLVLGGVISSSLFSALLAAIKYMADPYDELPTIVYWLMGSFSGTDFETISVIAFPMLFSITVLCLAGKYINVLSLGEDEAKSLGINVEKIRLLTIVLATLLSALCVATAGIIGWVGLIIPHIARFIIGPDNRTLLPFSALLGGVFLLIVDTLCRTLSNTEIPIGIVTALLGVPIFIFVLKNTKKGFQ